eukprot:m.256698 g.256698  ORF g.256698 m.256698 type:complete len:72 (+) comp26578_c0_seq5:3916-4131(+)
MIFAHKLADAGANDGVQITCLKLKGWYLWTLPRLPTSNAIWKEQESESDSLILEVKMEVFAYGDQHCAKMI